MPSTYTSSLRLTLPATGELSGSWGNTVNTGITTLTDAAIAGYTTVTMTDADYTLTTANGAADEARSMMLNITGTLTAARNVICPTASKLYIIKNATTGGFAITLKTSGGTGISIPNGRSMLLMCDGTNVVDAVTNFSSLTLGSPLLPASGGTGLTALGTGVATWLGTPSSANLAAAVTDETGSGALVFATSPTLVTPALGTPSSAVLTNATGLPISTGVSGLGTGIATFLGTPSSANLAAAVTDETGSGALVFGTSPTLSSPTITGTGTAAFGNLSYTGTLTGGTGVVNLGSGQFYKDASGNVGIGTSSPGYKLDVSGTVASTNFFSTGNLNLGNTKFIAFSASTPSTSNYAVYGDTTQTVLNAPSAGVLKFNNNNVEQMRLDSSGRVGIGTAPSNQTLAVATNITGGVNAYGIRQFGTIQSDVTSFSVGVSNVLNTAASAFTLTNYNHYFASQGTLGAGSAITTQYGYHADSSLTGATNNYGFFSNIASGTGRWNFYSAGTADNYFAGKLGLGTVNLAGYTFRVGGSLTGATTYIASDASGVIQPDVTSSVIQIRSNPSTASNGGTGYTIGAIRHFQAVQSSYSADSTITAQYGFIAESNLTSATNNYGFVSAIPSGTNRFNFYASGTADNYFAGNVGIGGLPSSAAKLAIFGNSTGATAINGETVAQTIQSDVTGSYTGYATFPSTQASAFALNTLRHFQASQGTIGAGSSVNFQYGFFANSSLTGATNNYGFFSDIASGTGRWNFFASGTADNYFAGNVGLGASPNAYQKLGVNGAYPESGGTSEAVSARGGFNSATLVNAYSYLSRPTIGTGVAATNLYHFQALPNTFTGTVTNQYGFTVGSNLTGATNNYGFWSDIASGTGRWNFYANGTADNYFAGNVGIGTATPGAKLDVSAAASGSTVVAKITNAAAAAANNQAVLSLDTSNAGFNVRDAQIRAINNGSNQVSMAFYTANAATPAEAMRIDNLGNLGIGNTNPSAKLDVVGNQANFTRYSTDATPFYTVVTKYRGTTGTPVTVNNNDAIGQQQFYAYDGTAIRNSATISAEVDGVPATSTVPGRLTFFTTPAGISQTPQERMRLDSSGNLGIGTIAPAQRLQVRQDQNGTTAVLVQNRNSTGAPVSAIQFVTGILDLSDNRYAMIASDGSTAPTLQFWTGNGAAPTERMRIDASGNVLVTGSGGFGYGTGSGGAVTQATSRTTGVTLNKTNGAITLVSAAGTATWQSFTVTNSTVAATDTVIVSQKSGTDLYQIFVTAVAAGSFRISFATTGGTTTEQPVFNFAVIKAVTA